MRIRAVVFTTTNAQDTPRLDQAWDLETAEDHTEAVHQALADVLTSDTTHHILSDTTHRAALVDIEVPDDRLLQLLDRPAMTVLGVVTKGPDAG